MQLGKKRESFSVGLKVIPKQWDRSRQIAVISNINTELDNHNNNLLNEKLFAVRALFDEIKSYLCAHPNEIGGYSLSEQFSQHRTKSKQMNAKATTILEEAFTYYYKYIRQNTKPKSIEIQRQNIAAFCKYVESEGMKDTTALLTQRGINDYKTYLIDKTDLANATINVRCNFIVTLINKIIRTANEFAKYKVRESVEYNNLEQRKDKEKGKHFSLTTDEVRAIREIDLKGELAITRDMFVLQLLCGQRISDIAQYLTNQNTERIERNGKTIVVVKTQKEGTTSTFEETSEMKSILSKYNVQIDKEKIHVCADDGSIRLDRVGAISTNRRLKQIAKKANLNREHTYYNSNTRKEERKPIYELISSHCARHTFASMKQLEGYSKEQIAIMIGHANTDMLNKVYAHNDKEANINAILGGKADAPIHLALPQTTKKRANVLEYLFGKEEIEQYISLYEGGVRDMPLLSKIDTTLRNLNKLADAKKMYKEANENEREQFRKEIESLQPYVLTIATHTTKEETYLYYQNKALSIAEELNMPIYTREQIYKYIYDANDKKD